MAELGSGSGSSYPTTLDTNNTLEVNSPSASKTKARAEVPNDLAAAIIAIETELGTDPAGTLTNVKTFLQTEHNTDGTHILKYDAGLYSRPKFEYIDANTIYIGAGQYWCKDKFCWWDAQLTSTNIGTPTASTWVYLYLDYSAITSGTEITNAELIWSETAPAYSHANRGWYNTDDRCIFAVYSDGSQNITEFYHEGDFIQFADKIDATIADTTPSNVFSDVTFIKPSICSKISVSLGAQYIDTDAYFYYRKNGQTGSTGILLGRVGAASEYDNVIKDVITDSSGIIEMRFGVATVGNVIVASVNGWYFGIGT